MKTLMIVLGNCLAYTIIGLWVACAGPFWLAGFIFSMAWNAALAGKEQYEILASRAR